MYVSSISSIKYTFIVDANATFLNNMSIMLRPPIFGIVRMYSTNKKHAYDLAS